MSFCWVLTIISNLKQQNEGFFAIRTPQTDGDQYLVSRPADSGHQPNNYQQSPHSPPNSVHHKSPNESDYAVVSRSPQNISATPHLYLPSPTTSNIDSRSIYYTDYLMHKRHEVRYSALEALCDLTQEHLEQISPTVLHEIVDRLVKCLSVYENQESN